MQATSKMERLTIYLTKEEKNKLFQLAQGNGRSMAMQARQILLTQLTKSEN